MRQRRVDELMDDPALAPAEHDRALAGLCRLNALSRSHRLLLPGVLRAVRRASLREVTILDVATGAADGPVRIARHLARHGVRTRLLLADASAHALAIAAERARAAGIDAEPLRCDAVAAPIPARADIVTCSLFVHHLDRADAVRMLGHLRDAARHAVAVADLDRSRTGLALAWAASRIASRSPVVHFDAPASVHAAYTADEARTLAHEAGMAGASVVRRWPCRWTIEWGRA
jgi:hypothetical protein